ncbi:hypothetical protein DL95DRAFT_498134 [Leptodontidium sp. 2 PMI_412]|nr:hypothetical protein DL95DRAFT_498134 [Leptodontidium sp. 2 PMI_412]
MAPPPISLIEDLRMKDTEKLTQLLVLSPLTDPHPVWLQEQADFIRTLPPKLKRPKTLFPRLTMAIPFRTQGAHLCPAHKSLNPYLIRRIFLQVSAECTTRLTRLAENRFLPTNIAIHVKTLQMANSLWMSPDLYRVTFQCQPEDKRFDRIASDCEACILATVGGNIQILKELRTSMLGREMKRKKRARLLPLVEAWIEWADAAGAIRADSNILAREVRSCRRQMQEARRQKRRNLAKGIVEEPVRDDNDMAAPLLSHDAAGQAFNHKEEDESPRHDHDHDHEHEDHGYDHDPEDSVIDFYADRISSVWQPHNQAQDRSSIHPAFRNSIVLQFQPDSNIGSNTDASYGSLPPRPGNIASAETGPGMNGGHGGAPESAPAAPTGTGRVHQPPPVSYHNRANQKYTQKQAAAKRETGYTESVYSCADGFGSGSSHIPPRQQSTSLTVWNPQNPRTFQQQQQNQQNQNSRWNATSTDEQAGESRGLSNVVENDAPLLWGWGNIDDGDKDENTDGNGNGNVNVRRDTHVTSFGDFIRK